MCIHSSGVERQKKKGREAGVGLAMKNSIPPYLEQEPIAINERIVTMRLALRKNGYTTIVNAYAPAMTNPGKEREMYPSRTN